MNNEIYRIIRYSFTGAIIIFILFVLSFALVFNTFFIMDESGAVPTCGAGVDNPSKFSGDIDVDTGKIYLGATTTPSLGIHDEHGVIFPKSDTELYYLYDKAGQTERKLLYEDINGDLEVTGSVTIEADLYDSSWNGLQQAAPKDAVYDKIEGLSIPTDISCKVRKSANQTIANSTDVVLSWNLETYDTDSMHDNSTNNTRITIKTAGKYHISCYAAWGISASGKRIIDFLKNGSSMSKTQYVPINKAQHTTSYIGEFDVNDYIEVSVFQDSGGDLNFLANERYFEAHKID